VRYRFPVCILLGIPGILTAQIPPSEKLSPNDSKLFEAEVHRIEHMLETAGDKCTVSYALARTWASGGQFREALSSLDNAIDLNVGLDPSNDAIFAKLRGTNEFKLLMRRVRDETPPVTSARAAFTVEPADLVPEGIAWDQRRKRFFLGSTWRHTVVECTPAGDCRPLVREGQDGLYEVLGVKADPRDGTVWAASNDAVGEPALFHFRTPSGELIRKYTLNRGTEKHLFNDLAISSQGDVYLTDSRADTVYWVSAKNDRLEVFDPNLKVDSANGIALSSDDKTLYVAGFPDGITVVDVASKSLNAIGHPPDLCLGNIDGLAFLNGSLIAIQNGVMTHRVVRYRLTPDLKDIASFEVLERRNPLFDGITTGAIADGGFYFMANTQLDKVTGGRIKPGAQFNPVQILRIDLAP
jgi:sugar lactone lactonase YvrE